MKLLSIFALLSGLVFSHPLIAKDKTCPCHKECQKLCAEGKGEHCKCKACDCSKTGKCKHHKCEHHEEATETKPATETPAATTEAK